MRFGLGLAAGFSLLSCHSGSAPTVAPAPSASGAQLAPEAPPRTREPRRFELVRDKPVDIGGGVSVRLTGVMEAHLADSKNELRMMLVATRGASSQEVSLERVTPGAPVYVSVLGVALAIDFVDAYHQPSTGAVLVLVDGGR